MTAAGETVKVDVRMKPSLSVTLKDKDKNDQRPAGRADRPRPQQGQQAGRARHRPRAAPDRPLSLGDDSVSPVEQRCGAARPATDPAGTLTRVVTGVQRVRGASRTTSSARSPHGWSPGTSLALEDVYDRWSALVHTYALRALGDPHDAEDVTQQVFVAAWRSRHTLTPSRVRPAGLADRASPATRSPTSAPPGRATPAGRRSRGRAARGATRSTNPLTRRSPNDWWCDRQCEDLPDPRRTIVLLAFWEGLSHTEIAESTGLPLGTVKSHVRRGLIQLHQQLEGVRQ